MEQVRAPMKLRLVDLNANVVAAWRVAFAGEPVEIVHGDILAQADADAIVSPANSHGWMDGGIDLAYARRWPVVEARLQALIAATAPIPVGGACSVETSDPRCPHMISAPTMEVPRPVPGTANAFLAMRAALMLASGLVRERGLLCPGLGTLTGRIPPEVAAWQMRAAWEAVRR